jgi:hypothetical protein
MNIELNQMNSDNTDINSSTHFTQLTDYLKTHMADILMKEQHGDQITYVILDDAEHTKVFPTMLAGLDENKDIFRIKSYGLSNSSLEQVFLRVADEIKRPEDYERLSCWKKFRNYFKRLCTKKDNGEEEAKIDETNDEEITEDQGEFNTGLSGKILVFVL